mgnify:CR=1 FL=1
MTEDTQKMIDAMHTKTPSTKTKIRHLSGGNQQKVILGRWLLLNPDIFLLDDPTRGIDVGAKYEIYQLIFDLAKQNKGVIICSSEMPELLGICDRVLVLSSGHLTGEYDLVHDREHATQEISWWMPPSSSDLGETSMLKSKKLWIGSTTIRCILSLAHCCWSLLQSSFLCPRF